MATRYAGIDVGGKKSGVVIQTSGSTGKKVELTYDTTVKYKDVVELTENILAALKEAKLP